MSNDYENRLSPQIIKNNVRRNKHKPSIGIALGGGAARGWAHIGVLKQLEAMDIRPDIICGCSSGAIVGAAYAVDNLSRLEKWALALKKLDLVRYFELKTSLNGFVHQEKFRDFFHQQVCAKQQSIAGLKKPFAAVATDLHSGQEVWLHEGKVIDAVWPSIALPGLFPPVAHQDRWLVDGGLVNPVPVSLCRALGADMIIAVNLTSMKRRTKDWQGTTETVTEGTAQAAPDTATTDDSDAAKNTNKDNSLFSSVAGTLREYSSTLFADNKAEDEIPGIVETVASSINIMQDRITRSRMAGDPPDVLLNPRLDGMTLMEFHRAEEAIQEGQACVLRMQDEIEYLTRTA